MNNSANNMENSNKDNKIEYSGIIYKGIISRNPVLIRALSIAPVLVVSTTLKNGLLLSADTFIILVIMSAVSSLFYLKIPEFLRPAAITLLSAVFVTPLCALSYRLAPNITEAVGIFLPLIAVNGIILSRSESFASKNALLPSIIDGAANGAGFAAVVIAISIIREAAGSGTLYEKALPGFQSFTFNFSLLPPGAFILLACVFAAVQFIKSKKSGKGS